MDHTEIDVIVGVDVAKGDHYAHAVTAGGAELFARAFENDQAAIEAVLAAAGVHGQVALVVDMTASAALLLLSIAAQRGVRVGYVTGLQMRRAADLYVGTAKTDPKDAFVIADYARRNLDRLTWLHVDDDLIVELRVLNGRDADLAADQTRMMNRVRDALTATSPALERVLGQHLSKGGVRDVIRRYPTPTALRAAGKARVRNAMKKRSPRIADKVATEIWAALEAQTITLPAEHRWGQIIADLTADIDRVDRQRSELGVQIEEVFLAHPLGKVLVTLCGFGPRTGARTLAEIGDPGRFANGAALASYAGLAPTDWRSGRSIKGSFAHRGGNHRLKNAMFQAAFVAAFKDPDAMAFYQRKREEGKKHNAAVICVARRRCNLIHAMLKNQTPYHANHHEKLSNAA